jgi:hypothetical protein
MPIVCLQSVWTTFVKIVLGFEAEEEISWVETLEPKLKCVSHLDSLHQWWVCDPFSQCFATRSSRVSNTPGLSIILDTYNLFLCFQHRMNDTWVFYVPEIVKHGDCRRKMKVSKSSQIIHRIVYTVSKTPKPKYDDPNTPQTLGISELVPI